MRTTYSLNIMIRCIALLCWIGLFITGVGHAITYTYDDLSQLIKVEYDDGSKMEYTYDKAGNILLQVHTKGAAIPVVTITSTDPNASEAGQDSGTFTVSRTGGTEAALVVSYAVSGTATPGTDYTALPGTVTIPAGNPSATLIVTPVDDTSVEGEETVVVTLSSSSSYTVGSPGSATVTIADNDSVISTISGTVTNNGTGLAGVTINLTGAATKSTTTDVNGNYSFSGLSNGAYTITPGKAGYTFTPPSINVNVSGADVTGRNFVAPLGVAALVSPSGTIGGNAPAYTWNAVPDSTSYYLYVNDSTGNKINTWYSAGQAGCPNGTGTCTVSPGTALAAGAAKWWVQTWNTNGYGPWSDGLAFTVPAPPLPGKVTLVSPTGTISTGTPAYTWNADPLSTWYLLYVNDSTGNKINTWYSAVQAGCSGGMGTCTASPGTVLAPGSAIWWVQTYGSNGFGPWSDGMSFTVPPGKAVLVSPTGTISTSTPDYTWNATPGSTWYYLYANDSTGKKIGAWYSKEQAGCSGGTGTCTVSPGTVLAPGSAIWWVQTYGSNGSGPWSAGMSFTMPPGKATLVSPSGTIVTSTPDCTWNAVPGSTWYLLYVNDSTGNKISAWYSKEQAGCSGGTGTCTVSPGTVLAPGSCTWWVQTYGSNGSGPWSAGMAFSVSSASGMNE